MTIKSIRKLHQSRDILYTWTVREIKVRYTDTSLGIAWLVLYPAAWVMLFTLLFSRLVSVPLQGIPYPLFVMSGLVPWFFLSNTVSNAVSSLKNNANLISKVYFPREILPIGSVLVGLIDLTLYLLMLAGAMVFYRTSVTINLAFLPLIVVTVAMLTLAASLLASRFALFQREVQLLVPLALQFLMYTVPVFYPLEIVPQRLRFIYLLNPLATLVDSFRRVLLYGAPPKWGFLCYSVLFSALLLVWAYRDFKLAEPAFADRL